MAGFLTNQVPGDDAGTGPVVAVIGAGIAGLLAAAALAPAAKRVILLEQDGLPPVPALRRRVPQGGHVHALLESGLNAMEALLPGFAGMAVAAGSLRLPARAGWRFHDGRGWSVPYDGAPVVLSQSRCQLEHLLRGRVMALRNIRLVTGRVTAITRGREGRVTGLQVQVGTGGTPGTLAADWVIDASGRGGQTAAWLESCGAAPVAELCHAPHVRYASLTLKRAEPDSSACAWLQLAQPPATRGVVAAPIEGQRWIVTLTDRFGATLPSMPDDFAAALRDGLEPELSGRLTAGWQPSIAALDRVRHFQIDRVRLRLVASAALPAGYLPIGDAIATFNPLHAQGMSVAALQARALGRAMARLRQIGPGAVQAQYLAEAEALARNAWQIGQAVDLAYPRLREGATSNALRRAQILRAAFATAAIRPDMARRVDRALHLLDPFSALWRPAAEAHPSPSSTLTEHPHETSDHGTALGSL